MISVTRDQRKTRSAPTPLASVDALARRECPSFVPTRGLWLLLLGVAGFVGCSSNTVDLVHKPVYRMVGKVLFEGKPLAKALVRFYSLDDSSRNLPSTVARTLADGTFKLSTYAMHDGAPEGNYAVSVVLKDGADGDNTLPPQYADPNSSGLTVRVNPGPNPPFVINLKK
jgi:hypothetical protein